MNIKRSLKRHLPLLYDNLIAAKRGEIELPSCRRIFAEPVIHEFLRSRFDGVVGGVFVEAGANDGMTRSNTIYLERHYGWKGLLVEALPHRFHQCVENRPASITVHAALVDKDFSGDYAVIADYDLMSFMPHGDAAIDKNSHVQHFEETIKHRSASIGTEYFVPTKTFAEIFDQNGVTDIDFLSLDIEGMELSALKGIDFDVVRPKTILVEDWDEKGISSFLLDKGYELEHRISEKDCFFKDAR